MLSYTALRNRYGIYTNNTTSANLSNGDLYIAEATRRILGNRDWPFLETQDTTQTTVASQQYYPLPADFEKNIDVTVTVGQVLYHPREETNRDRWDRLNYALNVTSNIPQWYFIYNGQVGIWPKPSTSGNTITFNYKKRIADLNFADYTTGKINQATLGSTVVLGTSITAWNPSMAGMFLQIAFTGTSITGDNFWYKIAAVPGTTTITLNSPYKGISLASGNVAYTIGQQSVFPENYQVMPVYYAAAEYWRVNGNNIEKSQEFDRLYKEMLDQFEKDWGTKSANPLIDKGVGEVPIINPNLTLTL